MRFTYSICHPDQQDIDYRNRPISGQQAVDIARHYPWEEELNRLESLDQEQVYYSPSLNFTSVENGRSLGITVVKDEFNKPLFSLWYDRPKNVKILFGLIGEKERMIVDDVWGFDLEESVQYLKHFVQGNYSPIEALYQ
jgi:hypothetical protein